MSQCRAVKNSQPFFTKQNIHEVFMYEFNNDNDWRIPVFFIAFGEKVQNRCANSGENVQIKQQNSGEKVQKGFTN